MVVAYNERAMMHRANATVFAVFCLTAVLGPSGLCAEELPELVDRVQASVVSIAAEKTEASPPPQATGDKEQDDAAAKSNLRQGSGMVLSADGYVITSTSLVDKVGKITVTFFDGKQATAQIIGRDPRTAIALLKASGATGLTAIHFGDANLMRRGSSIFSIGNTYGLQNSLSAGVIAAIRRSGGTLPHLVFQTDTVVQPGSTGAPLFNMKGEVVGMFTLQLLECRQTHRHRACSHLQRHEGRGRRSCRRRVSSTAAGSACRCAGQRTRRRLPSRSRRAAGCSWSSTVDGGAGGRRGSSWPAT